MLDCSLKLRPISLAETPKPSVNDAVVGLINHVLCHDDAVVRDRWQDGRCRAIPIGGELAVLIGATHLRGHVVGAICDQMHKSAFQ